MKVRLHDQVAELESEVVRVEDLISSLQTELSAGHGNQESLREQLASFPSHCVTVG